MERVSDFQILSNECLAPSVYRMVLAGDTRYITVPGQFIDIRLDRLFLRRPISVCDRDGDTVTVIYKVVGKGTKQMSGLSSGETLNVLTGLGNGYDLSRAGDRPVLVGGGVGVPPLYGLAKALLAALPEELSPERRAVVETACSLVGKVNYFWGGKSLVFGWDERWGTIQKVTAAGSSTTGTYRPYGMDCSGFVDWVFYNVTGGEYIIGHGGGATMQHNYCTEISWDEALPGDLVFYPGDEHVGIVGGRDENGELLIVHCAFSQDNVVITEKSGFVSIARPNYYSE